MSWHEDLLMAAFYHPVWGQKTAVTDGTKWCSGYLNEVAVSGEIVTMTATYGLSGRSKCTWMLQSKDGSLGPTIQLTKADYVNFLFFWVEWIDKSVLPSNTILSGAYSADYFIGTWIDSDGIMLNPAKATFDTTNTWNPSTITYYHKEMDPELFPSGSIGTAIYFSNKPGIFQST